MADTRQRTTWGSRFRFLVRAVGPDRRWPPSRSAECSAPRPCRPSISARGPRFRRCPTCSAPRATARTASWRRSARGAGGRRRGGGARARGRGARRAVARRRASHRGRHVGHRRRGRGRRPAGPRQRLLVHPLRPLRRHPRQAVHTPPELAAELGKLRADSPTTIVVLQKHQHVRHALRRARLVHEGGRGEGDGEGAATSWTSSASSARSSTSPCWTPRRSATRTSATR